MHNCREKQCETERKNGPAILSSRLFTRHGKLLEAVLKSEHLYQLHVLMNTKPYRSKLHTPYSCADELSKLIRKTVKQAVHRPNRCISNSHVPPTGKEPARFFTAYVGTFENSVGSYIKKKELIDGTLKYTTMYQYSCKVITSQEALYNMHSCGNGFSKDIPYSKQRWGRDTRLDLTTLDKQPISKSPLSKKPKGSTKKKSTTVTSAKKKASTVTAAKKKARTVTSPKKKESTVVTSPKKKESTVTSPKKKESIVTSPKKKKANKPRKKKEKRQPPPPNVQGVNSHSDVLWFLLVNDPVADMHRNMKVIDRDLNQVWVESLEPTSTAAKSIDQIM